ncbi:MAG: FAD-dependent oxidoreductase, partial [Rhodobacteraceae bacterium]|nr:FAD-dependent oxidoreductase [Paracoccaceae bacterium]
MTFSNNPEGNLMKSLPKSSKVVIIGGGIVGCSTAYHLAKMGVECLLLER